MNQRIALGLDVSKLTFDACLLSEKVKEHKKFSNDFSGFKQLLSWLHGLDTAALHACLEPTGVYSRSLAKFLTDNGIAVSMVNSYAVQCHGRSKNFRSKTDRIDAYLLADYCLKENPPRWEAPSQTQAELKELQHRLACIDEHIRQEENRLETVESKVVREDIKESLGRLYLRQKQLQKAAKELIRQDPNATANFAILNSIIGIGEKSAIRLLGLVQFEKFQTGRTAGAFAGLSPRQFESGTSIHRKTQISRIGDSSLRAALYFPAMVAIQHNPQMRKFAANLRARNKPAKVIICAVMRKLLVLATTLIRNQSFYDPNYALEPASPT
jgi:transposase